MHKAISKAAGFSDVSSPIHQEKFARVLESKGQKATIFLQDLDRGLWEEEQ